MNLNDVLKAVAPKKIKKAMGVEMTKAELLAEEIESWNNPCARAAAELRRLLAINAELESALNDAATSLETIHLRFYGEDSNLSAMLKVLGYAAARANVARQALEKAKQ